MKIAFFHNLPPGGAKKVMYEQIKHLSKKHTISLFQIKQYDTFYDPADFVSQIKEYNFSLENTLPGSLSRLVKDYANFFTLRNLHEAIAYDLDKENFDIIIVHPDKWTQAPFLLRFLKTKTIYYCEEWLRIVYEKQFEPKNMKLLNLLYEKTTNVVRKAIDKKNAISASSIVANSNYTADCIKKVYGRIATVIHPGVDTTQYKKCKKSQNSILFIGSLVQENGSDLLLSILPELQNLKIRVSIVDFFKKRLSNEELIVKYSESFATLCLSRLEPFGLVPIESMACQTPVIAVDEGGYKDTVIHNKTGYFIQRDNKSLLGAIEKLHKNKTIAGKMGVNARKHVIKYFSWEKHIAELENIF